MTRALERGLSVCDLLADGRAHRFGGISAVVGASRTAAMRLLADLAGTGHVQQAADGAWYAGPALRRLCARGQAAGPVASDWLPGRLLEGLVEHSGHSVMLVASQGGMMICLVTVAHPEGLALQTPGYAAANHRYTPWGWFFFHPKPGGVTGAGRLDASRHP